MDFDLRHILPLLIPIIAIVMGIGVALLAIWTDYRRKSEMFELHHKERLLAIERGMEVPPLPPEFFHYGRKQWSWSRNNQLQSGLILLFAGGALMIALAVNRDLETAAWGLLPFAVGLANLIYYFAVVRHQPADSTQQNGR